MVEPGSMTTKVNVVSFIAIKKLCQYYDNTGYKIIVLKFYCKWKTTVKKF